MVARKFARVWAWIALSPCVFCTFSFDLAAQSTPTCQGPPELEQAIKSHPSAGAYDAMGAYFGQQQKLSCAIAAFGSALRLEPNSWEAHFNLSLALLQSGQATRAVR